MAIGGGKISFQTPVIRDGWPATTAGDAQLDDAQYRFGPTSLKTDGTGDYVRTNTTGLEFAYTQAAKSMKSIIMSFWLLTVAAGNGLVALITKLGGAGSHDASVTPGRFLMYALFTFGVSGAFLIVAMLYRYRDPAHEGH